MKLCDLTLGTPEENLACDEALLDLCEAGGSDELLRLWALPQYFVVLGYANKAATEVNLPFCRQLSIPVLRRCTGGGTVLQGPGVLNYSLILRIDDSGPCHSIPATNKFILERHRDALAGLLWRPSNGGAKPTSPLADSSLPATPSGGGGASSSSTARSCCTSTSALLEKVLPQPSRQPDYRINRSHSDFLINLNVPRPLDQSRPRKAWNATGRLDPIPFDKSPSWRARNTRWMSGI